MGLIYFEDLLVGFLGFLLFLLEKRGWVEIEQVSN